MSYMEHMGLGHDHCAAEFPERAGWQWDHLDSGDDFHKETCLYFTK